MNTLSPKELNKLSKQDVVDSLKSDYYTGKFNNLTDFISGRYGPPGASSNYETIGLGFGLGTSLFSEIYE